MVFKRSKFGVVLWLKKKFVRYLKFENFQNIVCIKIEIFGAPINKKFLELKQNLGGKFLKILSGY